MKKLVLFFAVATAVAFASCGNKEAKTEEAVVEEAPVVEEVVAVEETVAVDTTVAEVAADTVVAEVEGCSYRNCRWLWYWLERRFRQVVRTCQGTSRRSRCKPCCC